MLNDRIKIQKVLTKIKNIRNKKKEYNHKYGKQKIQKILCQLYANIFLNLQKVHYFPAKYKLPKLSQETVHNMTRPINMVKCQFILKV